MTVEAGQPTISSATHVYIASVCGVAVAALMAAALAGAPPDPGPFIALAVLSAIIWSVGENLVESQVGITLLGILLLAAAVVVGVPTTWWWLTLAGGTLVAVAVGWPQFTQTVRPGWPNRPQ